jgi:hypothetical protein
VIRVEYRPMLDRPEGAYSVWLAHPDHPTTPFLVGYLRREGDSRWTAQTRDSGRHGVNPPVRRLPDRAAAAKWILTRSGLAQAPVGWVEPGDAADTDMIAPAGTEEDLG